MVDYLTGPGPHALELGRRTPRPGWLTSDLAPQPGAVKIDVAEPFPISDSVFDFAYSEHMIEHVSFANGQHMLKECFRILRPGGVLRIVTPSIEFLLRLLSADRGTLEQQYTEWSIKRFVPQAPTINPAFAFNHFVRGWGHQFIYNRDTLHHAFSVAGFRQIAECHVGESSHPKLSNLESAARMPPGFFALESMIMEGTE